jgi:hypothetical protein
MEKAKYGDYIKLSDEVAPESLAEAYELNKEQAAQVK